MKTISIYISISTRYKAMLANLVLGKLIEILC